MSERVNKKDKMSERGKNKDNVNVVLESFLISGFAGITSKTVFAPFERIRLNVQTQNEIQKAGRLIELYEGPIDCLRRVVKEEGIYYLWRGNLPNCIRVFPAQGLNFLFSKKE